MGKTKFCDSSVVYGKSYGNIYLCDNCNAYVGTHKYDNKTPLGRLANKKLRELKKEAHKYFDKIWKNGSKSRRESYKWLSMKLNIPIEYTHIGMFSEKTCKKVIELCKNYDKRNKEVE